MGSLSKPNKEIMVVERSTLFASGYFQGFSPADEIDYRQIIQDNYFYARRGFVETKPQFKQPIAYCIILNKESNHIFAYQRSLEKTHYDEKRLRGKWSWGIGGHVDKTDSEDADPIQSSMFRELSEEVELADFDPPEILGYINDDTTEVGEVHFGLLYLIRTSARKVMPKDSEIAWGGFLPLSQLEEIYTTSEEAVESWSKIGLQPLRKLLYPEEA